MRCLIVIPARMASTRFPGKPLAPLAGKPMVQWVWESACQVREADAVVIATPDQEIMDAARGFGADAELTRADHPSGTDRLAEVAQRRPAEAYVNVQGDEPMVGPDTISVCARALLDDPSVQVASLWAPAEPHEVEDPSVVKVVLADGGDALYFSRYAIPYPRSARQAPVRKHLGLYAFRNHALQWFASSRPGALEQTESLEQLRFLEGGWRIRMAQGQPTPVAVDTPEQAEQADRLLRLRVQGA